jgi:hypothetical protein
MDGSSNNLVFETLEQVRLLVIYQTAKSPTDAEWDAWLHAAAALQTKIGEFRLLVFSEGGHPSRKQIARVELVKRRMERTGGKKRSEPNTAVVSPSVPMRFVVSAMNLFNPKIRCYSPLDLQDAYEHLGLTPAESSVAEAALGQLRARIRGSSRAA